MNVSEGCRQIVCVCVSSDAAAGTILVPLHCRSCWVVVSEAAWYRQVMSPSRHALGCP